MSDDDVAFNHEVYQQLPTGVFELLVSLHVSVAVAFPTTFTSFSDFVAFLGCVECMTC